MYIQYLAPRMRVAPRMQVFEKLVTIIYADTFLDKLIGSKDALGFYAVLANLFCSLNRIFLQFLRYLSFNAKFSKFYLF